MKSLKRKLKRVKKFPKILYFLSSILYIIVLLYFGYRIVKLTDIETILRYAGILILVIYILFYLYKGLCLLIEKKYVKFHIINFITVIIICVMAIGSYIIATLYGSISNLTESEKINYTSYLIALTDTNLSSDSVIGMINDNDDIEGNVLAKKIISKNKLKQDIQGYDSYLEMLYDLYSGDIDALFVSSNYKTLFGSEEDFINIDKETKILYSYSEKMDNTDSSITSNKSLTEPFTVLILGVDSTIDGLNASAAFNGDTLILATINPNTLTATLFSIPRDTYVPIACRNGAKFKINSSAAYGTSCVIETIEDLTTIDIDYYVKINFKGVVELVDAVGGVEVDVEEPDYGTNQGYDCKGMVCEQNSDRSFASGDMVYIEPGLRTLNGEQALAYARNRHQYLQSDLARNRHQQDVIVALGKKIVKVRNYKEFNKILDAVMNNISTNMATNQILSGYSMLKNMLKNAMNDDEFINIEKTYLETYSLPIPYGDRVLSGLGYYEDSMDDIIKAMKINLELEESESIKTFSFSINDAYEGKVYGKGITSGQTNKSLSSYIGQDKSSAESYCENNNYDCTFTYIDSNSQYYNENYDSDVISYQIPAANSVITSDTSITFYVNGATE